MTHVGPWMLLSTRIDTLDPDDAIDRVMTRALAGASGYCCVGNVHQTMLAHDDPSFADVVNGAMLVMTDSRILHRSAAKLHRLPMGQTIRGAELMIELCRRSARAGLPIALIGGHDDMQLAELSRRLRAECPDLDIRCSIAPPFAPMDLADEKAMIMAIRASGARLVFVGLGCPKQERWMARHTHDIPAMLIGVGAAFDFNSGRTRTSPRWVHRAGLEWAWRLAVEPRRLWRRHLFGSTRFLLAYGRALWRR